MTVELFASIASRLSRSSCRLLACSALERCRVVCAVIASLLLVSAVLVQKSLAVFNDSTESGGNSFAVGSVDLVDDDLAALLFNVPAMTPGHSVTDCIAVTCQGTIANPSAVRVYSAGHMDSGDLDTLLNVTIEEGTRGVFGNCTGFVLENTIEPEGTLSDFDSAHVDYATGAGVLNPAGTPESETYRFTVELDTAAPNVVQGESLTVVTFNWEIQS